MFLLIGFCKICEVSHFVSVFEGYLTEIICPLDKKLSLNMK